MRRSFIPPAALRARLLPRQSRFSLSHRQRRRPAAIDRRIERNRHVRAGELEAIDGPEDGLWVKAEAWTLYEPLKLRGPGNPTGANQHTKKSADTDGIVDNINDSSQERPTGTSIAQGIRILQKRAAEGNADAIRELAEVEAGRKTGHPSPAPREPPSRRSQPLT